MSNKLRLELEDFRGRFAKGWTPDELETGLRDLSKILDLELICIWQGDDEGPFDGDSDLFTVQAGKVYELPNSFSLFNFLLDGEGEAAAILRDNQGYHPDPGQFVADFDTLRSDALFQRNFAWPR